VCVHTDRVQRQIIAGLAKLALDTSWTMTRSMDEFAFATVPPSLATCAQMGGSCSMKRQVAPNSTSHFLPL